MNVEYSAGVGLWCECAGFTQLRISDDVVILYQGEENTRRIEENGQTVLVTEHRVLDGGNRKGHIVIRVSTLFLVRVISINNKLLCFF